MKTITFILFFLCSVSFGQISLTSDDFLGLIGGTGKVLADTTDSVTVDVGTPGENHTWNFSSLELHGIIENYSFENPNQTAYADSFPQANLVQHLFYDINPSTDMYTFFDVKPQYMNVVGYALNTPEWNIVGEDSSKTALPINYGDSWNSGEIDTTGYLPVYDSTFTTIDAWGSVTVPAGTFECLRFRNDRYFTVTEYIPGRPPRYIIIDTSTVSYEWYTKDHFLVASVEIPGGEPDQNFTNAKSVSILQEAIVSSVSDDLKIGRPLDFVLQQNYPNPFNPITKINYQLAENGPVTLKIFDITGREIETLVDGYRNAGQYTVTFDGSNLSSGIYFYRIQAGKYHNIRKMILAK